jgi:ABC-2 type transport system ATP-binding protein
MASEKYAIEIKGLKKNFGKVHALRGVDIAVKQGESFGFLGPNGAGKTTTIRCLMDFITPNAGEAKIFGTPVRGNSDVLKNRIGYLPGNVRLYANWTGREHIQFVESIRGKSKTARKIAADLELDLSKKFRNLSSGNKQKLGLVLSLMSSPELLVMDEPTVGLDPLLQNTIYEILNELRESGTTIFISSHNLSEVEKICDRVAIIKKGKIIAVSKISELDIKKVHRIEVRIKGKFTAKEFEFNGVTEAKKSGEVLILRVEGHINPVIQKLAKYNLEDVEISHASLEEVFLDYYKGDK